MKPAKKSKLPEQALPVIRYATPAAISNQNGVEASASIFDLLKYYKP